MVLRGFSLEELDAALAQSQGDLCAVFAKHEILGRWQEVRHYPELAQRLIGVFDFRAHKFALSPVTGAEYSDNAGSLSEANGKDAASESAEAEKSRPVF